MESAWTRDCSGREKIPVLGTTMSVELQTGLSLQVQSHVYLRPQVYGMFVHFIILSGLAVQIMTQSFILASCS